MRVVACCLISAGLACGASVTSSTAEQSTGRGEETGAPAPDTGAEATTTPATTTGTTVDGDFIMEPDGGGDFECDNWLEDCPPRQKCALWANDGGGTWNATKCVDIDDDPKQPGEPCTVVENGVSGIDDCDLHVMCWNVNPDTNTGRCVAMCDGTPEDPSCAEVCHRCPLTADGVLNLCLFVCDPVVQSCPGNEVCIPDSIASFVCAAPGAEEPTTVGSPCTGFNSCSAGQWCADSSVVPGCAPGYCCTAFCSTTAADDCPPGMHCTPWFAGPVPPYACSGGPNVGACVAD